MLEPLTWPLDVVSISVSTSISDNDISTFIFKFLKKFVALSLNYKKRVAGHDILMKDQLLRGQNNSNIIRITSSQLSHFIHTNSIKQYLQE